MSKGYKSVKDIHFLDFYILFNLLQKAYDKKMKSWSF